MNSGTRKAQTLALLVGSNPLPNYLAASILQPREVVLIHTPETRKPHERLRAALQERDGGIVVRGACIDDATDARRIRDVCGTLEVDHLHYSGGTKPMAAHARQVFRLDESQASYLDERKGYLRFDDGYDVKLDDYETGLTLDILLKLHGIRRLPTFDGGSGLPAEADVAAMAAAVLCNPALVDTIRRKLRPEGKQRKITAAIGSPWNPDEDGLSLSVPTVPGSDWTNARYEDWEKFLAGGWIERWTATLIQRSIDSGALDVDVNVHCERALPLRTQFEIDVALIRGHRLYVVSCTTDRTQSLCKSKLFEIAMRARQMGGDLARSSLVCLRDGGDAKGTYVDQLRADIADIWDAPNVPRVFGFADLCEWDGVNGAPNLGSLKEWLES